MQTHITRRLQTSKQICQTCSLHIARLCTAHVKKGGTHALNLTDISFRDLENKYVTLDIPKLIEELNGPQDGKILCYCEISPEDGIMFFVQCLTQLTALLPIVNTSQKQIKIPFSTVKHCKIEINADQNPDFTSCPLLQKGNFSYESDYQILRNIKEFDKLRSQSHPDHISCFLVNQGQPPEEVWVQLQQLKPGKQDLGSICGIILQEPNASFGLHAGDPIDINLQQFDGIWTAFSIV